MALTKVGKQELTKEALNGPLTWAGKKLWPYLKKGFKASKNIPKGTYKGVRPVAKGVTRGITATGRAAARNPKSALTIGGVGGLGALSFKSNFKKNWLHTDPNQDLTYNASLAEGQGFPVVRSGSIKFKDPRLSKYYKSKKSDHILY